MDMREGNKRRPPRNEPEAAAKEPAPAAQSAQAAAVVPPRTDADVDDKPIPDDLSEISDDPDDILNREDVSTSWLLGCDYKLFCSKFNGCINFKMVDQSMDEDSQVAQTTEESTKLEGSEKESTQVK